jgi:serine/threonine protein kinase
MVATQLSSEAPDPLTFLGPLVTLNDTHGALPLRERPDPWIGVVLQSETKSSYLLQKRLGEGAFGAVYQAIEQPSGKKTAVKLQHAKHSHNKALSARFLQEEQIASRLEHPGAVSFYASGEAEDGTLWVAMEFVPGEPLDEYLRRKGALSIHEALAILGPICEVLDEAHRKGIIHRDLKPQNMMVVQSEQGPTVKVLDFGIAKFTGGDIESQTGAAMGTPMYMPPEQWASARKVTAASDIYSLGIIAYQCLSGQLPLHADSLPGWVKAHTQDAPLSLFEVTQGRLPQSLCDVVMQALDKEPEARFLSAMALRRALEDAIHPTPLAVSAPQPAAPVLVPESVSSKVVTAKVASSRSVLRLVATALGVCFLLYVLYEAVRSVSAYNNYMQRASKTRPER